MAPPPRDSPPFEDDYDEIIDARSPGEFADDHFPSAINLPVLSDDERAEVGTLHAEEGGFIAKRRGACLITANISQHLERHFADKPRNYKALVYCWRGGQRSQSLATILNAVGWKAVTVDHGYKNLRRYILDQLDLLPPTLNFTVVNGLTGTGKTAVLHALRDADHQIIDLEGLANHRGSLLGANPESPQPSQRTFETKLWEALAALDQDRPVAIEAESRKVGNLQVPQALWTALTSSPIIRLEVPIAERVAHLIREYDHFPANPKSLLERIEALRDRYPKEVWEEWETATKEGDFETFVSSILSKHYDRLYGSSGHYGEAATTLRLDNLKTLNGNTLADSIWPKSQ